LLSADDDLPVRLDDFHAREMLHVTFGSVLAQFSPEIRRVLVKHETAYLEGLQTHFEKHLQLLQTPA
jgi:tagaturonate epimerase